MLLMHNTETTETSVMGCKCKWSRSTIPCDPHKVLEYRGFVEQYINNKERHESNLK